MKHFFHHLFLPRNSNNHRPKILHHDFLFFLIVLLMIAQLSFVVLKKESPQVLGALTDVSSQELLDLTNKRRQSIGKSDLQLSAELSSAAYLKAQDMFAKNYWAHYAPDGTTPWTFFKASGYQYVYAGENLARGFSTTEDVVAAWMESPTHRDNMLSSNYQEVGFAVVRGNLGGEDTILVVEMFGARSQPELEAAKPVVVASASKESSVSQPQTLVRSASAVKNTPAIDSTRVVYIVGFLLLGMMLVTLVVDLVIIERKKIVRLVGHNLDHIFFLGGIFIFILLYMNGVIL